MGMDEKKMGWLDEFPFGKGWLPPARMIRFANGVIWMSSFGTDDWTNSFGMWLFRIRQAGQ